MATIPKIMGIGGPPLTPDAPALDRLSDEERAELRWGDEALTPGRDVGVTANEGLRARS